MPCAQRPPAPPTSLSLWNHHFYFIHTYMVYSAVVLMQHPMLVCRLCRISCALYAQFGAGKFPQNWWPVFYCVVAYVVLTIVLNVYSYQMEGDSFLVCKPRRVGAHIIITAHTHAEQQAHFKSRPISQIACKCAQAAEATQHPQQGTCQHAPSACVMCVTALGNPIYCTPCSCL